RFGHHGGAGAVGRGGHRTASRRAGDGPRPATLWRWFAHSCITRSQYNYRERLRGHILRGATSHRGGPGHDWEVTMPLSEYEQRVLEEMEQQLRSDDPKLADTISGAAVRRPRNVILGTLLGLAGIGLLVAGVANGYGALGMVLGIVGFLAMF